MIGDLAEMPKAAEQAEIETAPQTVFVAQTYTGKNTEQAAVTAWWDARLAFLTERAGVPRSPVIAVSAPDDGLDSDYDAEVFLLNELRGNPVGAVLSVPMSATVEVPTATHERAVASVQKILERLAVIRTKALEALTGAKSDLVGCKGCSSRVARAHLKGTDCPVCANTLMPPSTRDRYTSAMSELAAARALIATEKGKAKLKKGTWLVVAARVPRSFFPADLPAGITTG